MGSAPSPPLHTVFSWYGTVWFVGCGFAAGLVRGQGADEIRASVGRRLAGAARSSRAAQLGPDSEESPLQSKRSSTFDELK